MCLRDLFPSSVSAAGASASATGVYSSSVPTTTRAGTVTRVGVRRDHLLQHLVGVSAHALAQQPVRHRVPGLPPSAAAIEVSALPEHP
jgi:hypothetical protein